MKDAITKLMFFGLSYLPGILFKELICERYNHLISDDDVRTSQYLSTEKWLISRDVLIITFVR